MKTTQASRTKAGMPHPPSEIPAEVVADTSLSQNQKSEALDNLEQDARLLSIASNEGMTGGEASQLQEVMNAKGALELTPTQNAYALVLQDLRAQQVASPRDGTKTLIDHAVEVLQAIQRADSTKASGQPNSPQPGPAVEAALEAALEKLDP